MKPREQTKPKSIHLIRGSFMRCRTHENRQETAVTEGGTIKEALPGTRLLASREMRVVWMSDDLPALPQSSDSANIPACRCPNVKPTTFMFPLQLNIR